MITVLPRRRLRAVMEENRKKREEQERKDREKGKLKKEKTPRKNPPCIEELYPEASIIDVTSKSRDKFVRMSPFYPHRGIPVPYSPYWVSASVEAIWQGLKVFEKADIDTGLFQNTTMKNLKRISNMRNNFKYGRILGHRKGVTGRKDELLGAVEARRQIYAPAYRWVLENKVQDLVAEIRELSEKGDVVLVDFETNCDINLDKPISHAGLIKAYIEGKYPEAAPSEESSVPLEILERLPVGRRIKHAVFGVGRITEIQGSRATVQFHKDKKTFDLRADALEPFDGLESFHVECNGEAAILLQDKNWLFGVQENPDKKVAAIPCEYEQIIFYAGKLVENQKIPTYYFLVKKNGLWGLLNKLGRQQAPCIYDDLRPEENNGLLEGFSFTRKTLKGIINGKGIETIEKDGE